MTVLEAPVPVAVEGYVHSWELVTATDGPGTRFVTWLTGCALRCRYCHNPDTWWLKDGTLTPAVDLLDRMARYRPFLLASGGGMALTGGEPLLQPTFSAALFRGAKELGLHTALDTAGYLGRLAADELLDDVDLVLLDIKSSDAATYKTVTGRHLAPTIRFAERLAARGDRTWIRFVLVPGLTDGPSNVAGVARIVAGLGNVDRVEVLPYHDMARKKYAALGLAYPLPGTPAPTPEQVEAAREPFRELGIPVL